ncbi:DUF4062 domain-containing protein [Cellulomonas hominis]|uniref:DUF4062 domain-containing protein n=1 Tax=Cellulomonas hominis TaxID=156981 RepID=UPI001B94A94E|nr:DUF4062 domain-containing protein [Cellulomonas hominis]VTR77228.1 hypothetical protein CHMI_01998 [Cellulomonas hominis]
MAVEKREQVFISSTFKDLVDERRAVTQTLLEADCIPSGMELFPASDSEKWDLIKGVIDLCDYYVVIVGGRYGSVDDAEQLSYTEMEFDYAVRTKKPIMGFLHGSPGKLPGDKLDLDKHLREKLDAFRDKIEKRMVKYWHEPGDLPGQVALAIMQIRKSHPAVGWIRASEAMTPGVKAELAELRARVRELTADLHDEQRQKASAVDPSDLVQGDDSAPLECTIEFQWQWRIDAEEAYVTNRQRALWTVNPTWNDVLKHVGPELMDEASEEYLRKRLSSLCDGLARRDLLKDDDSGDDGADAAEDTDAESHDDSEDNGAEDNRVGRIYDVDVTIDSFNDVKVQFSALGLIEKGTKRRPGSDTSTYWRLTERGEQQLLRLRALRKPVPVETGRDPSEGAM